MKYYLIGIKGAGMSALAGILHDLGNTVVGYDDSTDYKFTLDGLEKRGIKIYHDQSFTPDKDFMVCFSNAIKAAHPEIIRMNELGLKLIRYQDLIGSLTTRFETISVAGTHGKTTTSLMISNIMDEAFGCDYFVGDGRGHADPKNKLFILESCEYNKHFLEYYPETLVVTNIELEHTECYKDLDDIIYNFNLLANQTHEYLVLCGDDPNVRKIKCDKQVFYYGLDESNDLVAKNVEYSNEGTTFDAYFRGELYGTFSLNVFGKHMVLDSLAAIMVSILYNVDKKIVKEKLINFSGAVRRFNETKIGETIIIDDYAHHPTEIAATLDAAMLKYPDRGLIAVFLPNTYSRTKDFMDSFAEVFNGFDYSYIMDIKCDREDPADYPGVTSDSLIEKINHSSKISTETLNKLLKHRGQVICFMSCANISPVIEEFKKVLRRQR